MNKKRLKEWMEHWDFILLDYLGLQLCFLLTFFLYKGFKNPIYDPDYIDYAEVLLLSQLAVNLFSDVYSYILGRSFVDEVFKIIRYALTIYGIALIYIFIVHRTVNISRLQALTSLGIFIIYEIVTRSLNKLRIRKRLSKETGGRSIVLFTSSNLVDEAMKKLNDNVNYKDYFIRGIVMFDAEESDCDILTKKYRIYVHPLSDEVLRKIGKGWVDEVFILQPDHLPFPTDLMDNLMDMGITVNYCISAMSNERWSVTEVNSLGKYKVLTNSMHFAPAGQLFLKRLIDIIGGLIGTIFFGLLYIIIGPLIYFKSPGPILFKQKRIGKNGRLFNLYKFRSMYMDAEKRKAELMKQNKYGDGLMFKMENDPRIIGCEKVDKNGRPRGIGNFIRETSLDEFPQFLNVLSGQMSLVGWRPATVDEWNKYDLRHRIRARMKPGLTGMWQVSGRSEITNFDEVVGLDREYIENWSIGLDIKILMKTVIVVLKRSGAS